MIDTGKTASSADIARSNLQAATAVIDAVDCDIHPSLPGIRTLLPHLDDYWRESLLTRGIYGFDTNAYPNNSPLTVRSEWRAESAPHHAVSLEQMRRQALDPFGVSLAICNCLYGVQLVFSEDMGAGFARGLNRWIAREWLDAEPRLRASIVVPMQNPELAAEEIDLCAQDERFVQVMMLVMGDMPLGRRHYWPIYAAAQRHGLPVCIHAGSMYRHPVTGVGWPTYHVQDYFSQAAAFQAQLASLICEGVFSMYPDLKFVFAESGVTWLPPFLWRLDKYWNALRLEVPWLDRAPTEIVRSNIRFTLQPFDAPRDAHVVDRLLDHMQSDELILFSTDYPHSQFDEDPIPYGLSPELARKFKVSNPLATYARLRKERVQ